MNQRIVLCSLDARYDHVSLPLLYLRNAAETAGWEVELIHLSVNADYYEILCQVSEAEPEVLGIPVYIWNAPTVIRLIKDLKQLHPPLTVITGGPECGAEPERWLERSPETDLVVCGPGEAVLGTVLQQLAEGRSPLPRVLTARSGDGCPPSPYRPEDAALVAGKLAYFESSRGCPFSCSYCFSGSSGQSLLPGDRQRALQELIDLAAMAPKVIKLVDRSFNADREHARFIWRGLLASGVRGVFHFEIHPLLLEEEDFELLAQVPPGLFQFEVGVQSVHAETRRLIRRHGDWNREEVNLRRLITETAVPVHVDLICGLPGETVSMIAEGVNRLLDLAPSHLQTGFLKLLPGTPLKKEGPGYGMIAMSEPPYRILQTASLRSSELLVLHRIEAVIELLFNSGRFRTAVQWLTEQGPAPFELCSRAAEAVFRKHPLELKDFMTWSRALLELAADLWPALYLGLSDSLLMDWGRQSNARSYPELFGPEPDALLRRRVLEQLVKQSPASSRVMNSGVLLRFREERFCSRHGIPALLYRVHGREPQYFTVSETAQGLAVAPRVECG